MQLPPEGTTIHLGWEPSGAVLAVVQKLGGAFLWFPSKPESVQQWEGMQFCSKILRNSVRQTASASSNPVCSQVATSNLVYAFPGDALICEQVLKRNQHFDTDFACWSEAGKLVLGLADGNFAVWDLRTNKTFISRGKHFAGKLKEGISCGAWGPKGDMLALGSANQLKVSKPMSSASWEQTAAKLHQPHKKLNFLSISFSPGGSSLAVLLGTSPFAHLFIYDVKPEESKENSMSHVHEMQPNGDSGPIKVRV